MPLHRLTSITMGVPDVAETAAYYRDFGRSPQADGRYSTRDAGRRLRIRSAHRLARAGSLRARP
ncbi:hypothetical protein OG209_09865 [Streptomyces sp. NBC_01383]|uniref:hypothetical protein n=1 Tax=Streptomyces sp. NBC_01383 TaxID=2903846 RepID=UPI003255300F